MGNEFFAKKIKQLRKERGLTMEQLAEEMEVTKSRVNMWENKGSVPRQDVLLKLAKFFGVSIDELLGNDVGSSICGSGGAVGGIMAGLAGSAVLSSRALFGKNAFKRKNPRYTIDDFERQILKAEEDIETLKIMLNEIKKGGGLK